MIVLSNSEQQTLEPGQSLRFDVEILKIGNTECHRKNTSSVKMKQCGLYRLAFHANCSSDTSNVVETLAMALSGEVLPETTMAVHVGQPGTVFRNVSAETRVANKCGDYDRVSIINTGEDEITVDANSVFIVERL